MNKLKDYFINRIKSFTILFKNPKTHPSYLIYILLIFIAPIFLMTFQNCKATNLDTSSIGSGESTLSDSNYNKGHIIRIDTETDEFIEDELLLIDTDIKMKFINAHEDADSYKWTINRGFEVTVDEASTDDETYQTQFAQVGAYDVLAKSYESETFLRSASKRFVAGESCSLTDILEIELSSGSLQVGQSATFDLRYSDEFSSTKWKATLPSGSVIEQTAEEEDSEEEDEEEEDTDPNTLDISFENESEGSLLIEVSASHVDRSDCLTYRKQSLNLTSTKRPHFNPIVITDGSNEIAVMLENNDVYKYERPTNGGPYLQVEVLHADTCNYQVNEGDETSFTCDSGSINISLDSGNECSDTTINLSASISDSQEDAETRTYYNFCPKDSDYCYFGLSDERQGYNLCPRDIAGAADDSEGSVGRSSFEADPANGRCGDNKNECQIGQLQDVLDTDTHYQWQCLGISGGTTTDCEKRIPIDGTCDNSVRNGCSAGDSNDAAIADTTNYYKWACEGLYDGSTANNCQIRIPINGACNNNQRNGCSAGNPNDGAIADTETHYRWHCEGQYGGTTATGCQRKLPPQPVNGVCNNSQRNGCSAGDPDDAAIADTSTHYTWHCKGQNGGTAATDCQIRIPINGVCNNSQRNSCSVGEADDAAIADTNTYYKWHCKGQHGGAAATNCQIRIPINGACNNNQRNSCSAGDSDDVVIADTSTHYTWHCKGQHGGTTATDCQIRIPINGACNNNQRNSCSAGEADDAAIADTSTHYKWHCKGQHGGTAATNCQIRIPINGACNNNQRNSCSAGEADDAAIADTSTHYKWHCKGQHGGATTTDCQIRIPINGACNNNQRNDCSTGTPSPIADSATHHRWHCEGLHGGTTATGCQKTIPPDPVNGTCDNSLRNGCSAGTSNDGAIADTTAFYKWHCEGLHGGTTVTDCQIRIPINGACNNSQRNGCSAGTANDDAIADTTAFYKWHCEGLHSGTTAENCQIRIPINGACNNNQRNGCSAGSLNDGAIADTTAFYKWHCEGLHGGTTAESCQIRIPINGACNNNQRNGCSAGSPNDGAIADTGTHYKWHCEGLHGGTTAESCQIRIPTNGACNNNQRNGCSAGSPNDGAIADTSTYYKWHCDGLHGGTTAENCQIRIPINGVCNNNQRNGCSAGSPNDSAIADTGTHYTWHCEGLHGGSTATGCRKAIPINGVCDNSRQNGCASGTSNDRAADDTDTHYKWYCVGSNGGTTDTSCEKPKPIDGVCNNEERNGCSAGNPDDEAIADTTAFHKWHCVGQHGGSTVTDCQKTRAVDGSCNNGRVNGCRNGTTLQDIDDTDNLFKWQCVGRNGGRTLTCSRSKAICSLHKNLCEEGSPENLSEGSPVPPTPEDGQATHYTWTCVSDDRKVTNSCRTLKKTAYCGGNVGLIEGVDVDVYLVHINTCLTGTVTDTEDSEDYHRWRCYWYESRADCSVVKHAECRPSSAKLCNDGATRTNYDSKAGTWSCHGGTSSVRCSRDD